MKDNDRKRLEEALAALSEPQKRQLYKLAALKRKAARSKAKNKHDRSARTANFAQAEDDQQAAPFAKRPRRDSWSLEDWVLLLLQEQQGKAKVEPPRRTGPTRKGLVISVGAGTCQVAAGTAQLECLLRGELAMGQRTDLAVGDEVEFFQADDGTFIVEHALPRRTVLSRPDPHNPQLERVVAANIDLALIVVSVADPPLSEALIDRYLLAVERGRIEPLICLNKIDLLASGDQQTIPAKLDSYRQLAIKVVNCSAVTGQGIDELMLHLAHKMCVVVGHSGVGKSALLNAIRPELALPVGQSRKGLGKGRHTTTRSTLYDLGCGTCVIDTPGIREFGLWQLSPEELRWYFSEFDAFADHCKFSNCSHTHEPDCAVKTAVQLGRIAPLRYQSYCRIFESLE